MASNIQRPFSETQAQRMIMTTIRHMERIHNGDVPQSILFGGDPGVGKTTLIKTISSLLGIPAYIIEVPHITEEHIINVPFLYFKNNVTKVQQTNPMVSSTEAEEDDIDITLAESKLYSQLMAAKPLNDAEYLKYINTQASDVIVDLFKKLGGDETTIPEDIKDARSRYTAILFIDELYRKTSTRIRNILRDFLDKKIGMHELPRNVYVVYATNVHDEGIDSIPGNYEFQEEDYANPTSKEWFEYFVNAHSKNSRNPLLPEVVTKFRNLLKDEHIVHIDESDPEAKIRTSPRRWEQLILGINASLPIKTPEEGRALLTFVKNNFVHFASEKYSNISGMVLKAVSELIQETSKHTVATSDVLEKHEWRGALSHAVQLAKKMGENRKYIPVISGPPGIGKTSELYAVAQAENLILINMKVTTLSADDVYGMPAPKNVSKENIKIKFSLPVMYKRILMQIKTAETAYFKELRKEYGDAAEEKITAFKNQEWKYLLFLDELNRCPDTTFNALRRVILEKDFGPADEDETNKTHIKLPEGTIVAGAINPTGGEDVTQLTEHFRDVVDIIPARTKWEDVKKFLFTHEKFANYDESYKNAAMGILQHFIDQFKNKVTDLPPEDVPYSINIANNPVYVSGRMYTGLFSRLCQAMRDVIRDANKYPDIDAGNMRRWANDAVYEAISSYLRTPMSIADVSRDKNSDAEDFLRKLKSWISKLPGEIFGDVFIKKTERKSKLGPMLLSFLEGQHKFNEMSSHKYYEIINVNESMKHGQVADEIRDMLLQALKDNDSVKKYVLDQDDKIIEAKDGDLVESSTPASKMAALFTALLSTLVLNKFDTGRLDIVKRALSTGASEALGALIKAGKLDEDTTRATKNAVVKLRPLLQKIN